MHIHASFLSFSVLALKIIIFGFLWRAATMRWHDTTVAKAMAFIY